MPKRSFSDIEMVDSITNSMKRVCLDSNDEEEICFVPYTGSLKRKCSIYDDDTYNNKKCKHEEDANNLYDEIYEKINRILHISEVERQTRVARHMYTSSFMSVNSQIYGVV